jgi:hypothetical protein
LAIAVWWIVVNVVNGEGVNCPMSAIAFVFIKYLVWFQAFLLAFLASPIGFLLDFEGYLIPVLWV